MECGSPSLAVSYRPSPPPRPPGNGGFRAAAVLVMEPSLPLSPLNLLPQALRESPNVPHVHR